MCPPEAPKRTRKPPVTRKRQSIENYKVMRWLDDERRRKGLSLRDVAQVLGPGYRNATRVGEYLDQRVVAGPVILQRLAIAVGVSPIDALWNARQYGAIFNYLDKLYRLGWSWAQHDRADVDQDTGADFMWHYVDKTVPPDGGFRAPPPSLAHRYHVGTLYNSAGTYRIVVLPKPMACAILLAVGLFPRRGDQVCDEMRGFYHELGLIAEGVMPQAELARIPAQNIAPMQRPLKAAQEVLKYRFYGAERYAIVGEYVHKWCDFVCRWYAHYARLAAYCEGGVLDILDSDMKDLWKYFSTSKPSADDLRIDLSDQ